MLLSTPSRCLSIVEIKFHFRYWKCNITGSDSGSLVGKRVAIKDNIAVAGVPMMNGSRVLEGYVPEFDATIVTRILDAGKWNTMNSKTNIILQEKICITQIY